MHAIYPTHVIVRYLDMLLCTEAKEVSGISLHLYMKRCIVFGELHPL